MLETMEKTKKRYWHEDMCRPTRFDKFVFVLVLVFLFLKMVFLLFQILQNECGKWQNLTLKILCQGACQLLGSCSASRDADGK